MIALSAASRNGGAALATKITSVVALCPRAFSAASDLESFSAEWNADHDEEQYKPGQFHIQTFNKISAQGLKRFPQDSYKVKEGNVNSHAILLRSHKLQEEEVDITVRAIARCGAGTNNVPVARMTELGIPVFNTPGANANAVKELVLCGILLASRRIVDGVNHMKELGSQGLAKERVEKDKAMFGGRELKGKTLAVIGLGHIGAATARDAAALGMNIAGYDPGLSITSALMLPRSIGLSDSIAGAVAGADYISVNIPYIKGEDGTHGIIGKDVISHCKPDAVFLNFARGELVDSVAMKDFLNKGDGRYVSDFPDDELWDHKNTVIMPHLGASTGEAEDEAASMAADTIREYLETGTIRNSVNFPSTTLPDRPVDAIRFTVVNRNEPGMLAQITDKFGKFNLNIVQQINQSRSTVAYNVIDVVGSDDFDLKDLHKELTLMDGVLSSRVIYNTPGAGYARNVDGEYCI